ncbi:hypothetical protein SCLCIDRAFT_30079 [Scleroderma citrinum Foug A]|uniref:Uncharacterized protein n=1 Tax=Scleroderma citrinum Foug A TaxID=1036808 RepID=A0A0C3D4T8_9AGAM|nr:hypothetical protein SCLCIDRAFT_30079 [Scleroderma citrinum Foug A]
MHESKLVQPQSLQQLSMAHASLQSLILWQSFLGGDCIKNEQHTFFTWNSALILAISHLRHSDLVHGCCHAPNMFGTVDIGIISPAFQKLKSFFKNIFIGLKHLELRKRKIVDVIPRTGYYEFKKDSDANDMTVQQYYCKTYNIHIK